MRGRLLKAGLVLGAFFALLITTLAPPVAHADAGHVIDDAIFNNTGSLSADQINSFLNNLSSSSCISTNNHFVTPDPLGYSASQGKYTFGGNVNAGQAIHDIAVHYDVNPEVILAQMQKEQSIPTGSAGCYPTTPDPSGAVNSPCGTAKTPCTHACPYSGGCMMIAMSYACPNYCYAEIEGFSNQISAGTWVHRYAEERAYGILTGYAGYDPGDENFCYTGPMTAGQRQRSASTNTCKGVPGNTMVSYDGTWTDNNGNTVTIANGSTASLYNYTPFTTDTKFQTIYNNWFGPTLTAAYSWQWQGQGVYTDSTMSTAAPGNLIAGQRYYAVLKAKNVGTATWQRGMVKLGTWNPADRSSAFHDSTWPDTNRAAQLTEASVAPGATGTFGFWITAPSVKQATNYSEYFNLVAENVTWFNDQGFYFPLTVQPQKYTWSITNQQVYYDSADTIPAAWDTKTTVGQKLYAVITVKNTGNMTWQQGGANPIRMATSNPGDRNSSFCDSTWPQCNRPAGLQQATVAPGGTGTFKFVLNPSKNGSFKEGFGLVSEGKTWFNDLGFYLPIEVGNPSYTWSVAQQAAYSDAGLTTPLPYNITMSNGGSAYLVIKAKNTGNVAWSHIVKVGTSGPSDRSSSFHDSSWLSTNRAATYQESNVFPGQTGTFVFKITASRTGSFKEAFNLVAEGKAWFNDLGLYYPIKVN